MDANDIESESDPSSQFQEIVPTEEVQQVQEIHEFILDDGNDEDVHVCRKCNIVFYDVQKYMEHKVKHDNYRLKICKSSVDRRMIMPQLVQRQTRPKKDKATPARTQVNEQNETSLTVRKGKVGRPRLSEMHSQDLVIKERIHYTCTKCDRKFSREASLKRHMEYDHQEKDSDDDDDDDDGGGNELEEDVDDDEDKEYKPSTALMKETQREDEEAEQEMIEEAPPDETEAPPEIDSLDQVIMAAALVEKAEAQQGAVPLGQIQINLSEFSEETIAAAGGDAIVTSISTPTQTGSGRRSKSAGDDKDRRYECNVCKSRFKELAVLKAHMLTHTGVRDFKCVFKGCNYAFKTKGSLKRHMRRHTGERPYVCELCNRSFTESGALTRHLKSRVPCAAKTDDELPRYKKTWTTDPNIPAAGTTADLPDTNDNRPVIQSVSVVNVKHNKSTDDSEEPEHYEELTEIEDSQDKHLFAGSLSEGAEVVIAQDETMTADDSIQEFVHSETVGESDYYMCKVCHEEFLSLEALKTHLRTHLAEDTCKCQLCHFITDNKEEFENHMFLHHHVQIRSSDPLADLVLSRAVRNDPAGNDTIEKAQIALKQLMSLPNESGEIDHNIIDSLTESLYKCPVCNKSFRRPNYLKFHMRNHTGLRPHKCGSCDRSFITRDTLKKHMASHVEDRSFKCGECGKLFKRLSHVREHIKIHSAVRPYRCPICDKSFKTNNAMKVHLRTHTDILPYECQFCHRRFREKGSVIRHTRMHTGEKPFECRFCGRKFAEHGTLNRHLKAKVSCRKQSDMMKDIGEDDETDYSVLAEFSSVVADTQQYMVPENEEVLHVKSEEIITDQQQVSSQPTEIVVVESNGADGQLEKFEIENIEIGNVEVLTNEDGSSTVEGIQVTDDYIVVTDANTNMMSVLDSKTGETVAVVPITNADSSENQVQTITMSQEGEISTVTMVPEKKGESSEMIAIAQLIEDEDGLQQVIETEDGLEVQLMETD